MEWVFQGEMTRTRGEAADLCRDGVTVECMEWVFQGDTVRTRSEAANLCKVTNHR